MKGEIREIMLIYTKKVHAKYLRKLFPFRTICKIVRKENNDNNDKNELYATASNNLEYTAILEKKKIFLFIYIYVLKEVLSTYEFTAKYKIVEE